MTLAAPRTVYLDHAATTPLDEAVLEAMLPYLREHYGNASSVHTLGRRARFAVEEARERVATVLGAEPAEIVFTSGGTESNNTALRGVLAATDRRGPGLVTSAAEHKAVLQPAHALELAGHPVTVLTPLSDGAVVPDQVTEAITETTGLVSVMHVNNEVGTLSPVSAIGDACRERGVPIHCDAVQSAGLYRLDVDDLRVDLMSLSAHKFYGPKGIGALYVRTGTPLNPLVLGGAQERQRRGGTENVASIVGLVAALELAVTRADAERERLRKLQLRLAQCLRSCFDKTIRINTLLAEGDGRAGSAPHVLSVSFPPVESQSGMCAVDGEMLLLGLDRAGVCASTGSACTSGAVEPSHVLRALGVERSTAAATVRFSFGRSTTEADVDYAAGQLTLLVERTRSVSVHS